MQDLQTFFVDTAKFAVLLLLGAICTILSVICLTSIGLGISLLSEQAATWFKTSQWHHVPLGVLFKGTGYAPDAHWSSFQPSIEQLLSSESGLVLVAAAATVWSVALIRFNYTLKKWRPPASIF